MIKPFQVREKMKKLINMFSSFIILILVISYFLLDFIRPSCQEKGSINVEELSNDFKKAYDLFENASITDINEGSYEKAIYELKKVIEKTKNDKEKVFCYFLISFGYFLEGEEKESLKNAKECFTQCQNLFKDENKILILKDLIERIENKEIKNISDILSIPQLGTEIKEFIEELIQLYERRQDMERTKKDCWSKYKNKFEEKIGFLNNEYKLENFEEVKRILNEKYEKKGWFIEKELKEDFIRIALEKL